MSSPADGTPTPNPFGPDPGDDYLESLRPQIVRVLRSEGCSDQIAEEAAQQAIFEGQAAIHSGAASNITDLLQWLLNKAKNAARRNIDKERSRKAEPTRLRPGQFADTVNEAPCKRIDSDEYQAKVRALLHLLPKREREAMELYLEGANYLEVALALGVRPPTACAYRTRAYDRLKLIMRFYFPPD